MRSRALAGIFAFILCCVSPAAAAPPIVPFLDCVNYDPAPPHVLTALFGYYAGIDDAVEIDVGSDNFFSPDPSDMGQPTLFFPGLNHHAFEVSFALSLTTSVSWTLLGHTITADVNAPRCDARSAAFECFPVSGRSVNLAAKLGDRDVVLTSPVQRCVPADTPLDTDVHDVGARPAQTCYRIKPTGPQAAKHITVNDPAGRPIALTVNRSSMVCVEDAHAGPSPRPVVIDSPPAP